MSDGPKRKRIEKKTPAAEQPVVSLQKFYCSRCGTAYSRLSGNFTVSHSPMYRGTGYLPICNDCVDKMFEEYRTRPGWDDKMAMRRMCMKLDLYWNDSVYEMVARSAGIRSKVRTYVGKTNIIHYLDKTYDDSIAEEEKIKQIYPGSSPSGAPPAEEDEEPDPALVDFWGRGYDKDMYVDLQKRYDQWTSGLNNLEQVQISLYKQVCLNEEIIARAGAKGETADKASKNLMDALGSLGIKPSQTKNDPQDAELEKMPLGVGVYYWENMRPLPPTKEELKDKSGLIRNILTWVFGHLCKMVGLRNSYSKLYEDAVQKYRVERPEFEDEDDETMLADIFGPQTEEGNGDSG